MSRPPTSEPPGASFLPGFTPGCAFHSGPDTILQPAGSLFTLLARYFLIRCPIYTERYRISSARRDTGCSSPDQGLHDKIVNRGHLHMRVCTHTGTGSVERHRRGFEHRETCYRATLHNTTDGKLCLQNARTPTATAQVCAGGLSLPRHSLSDSGTNRLG